MVVPGARASTMYSRARELFTASAGTSRSRAPTLPGPVTGAPAELGIAGSRVPALAAGPRRPVIAPATVAATTITGARAQRPRRATRIGRFELTMPTTPSG